MTVSVITCAYGLFDRFLPRWREAVRQLDPQPDAVIVVTDAGLPCPWKHPQAFYLNAAVALADTDWAVISDVDDHPKRDALDGLDAVDADVWQMGFDRSDGETYIPRVLDNDAFLASDRNVYVGSSAIRIEAFNTAGGYPDVALQDWALWRRLAANGARFESSGRTHFHYMRHPNTRGTVELTASARAEHLAEMKATEALVAA